MSDTRARRIWIGIGAAIAAVIVLNLLANGLDRAVGGNEPGGASDSSYATGAEGLAAYASLLGRFGHDVGRQRGELTYSQIATADTVVLVDPVAVTEDDAAVLLEFVSRGGLLVIADDAPGYLHEFRDDPPQWAPAPPFDWTGVDPALGDAQVIRPTRGGVWITPGSGRVLVGTPEASLVTVDQVGEGEIVFVADPSPLENGQLDIADNAAFALGLAGPGRRVVFAEGTHGFGTTRGIAAIPVRWKYALGILALGALAFVWSRARRFGPPDRVARELPPARAEYVRALSQTLERTHDRPHALAHVQQWTRERVIERAALRPDANNDEVARAARALGCDERDVSALLTPVTDDNDVLALGRTLARVTDGDRRHE